MVNQAVYAKMLEEAESLSGGFIDVDSPPSPRCAPVTPKTPKACTDEAQDLQDPFYQQQMADWKKASKEMSTKARKLHGVQFNLLTPPAKKAKSEDEEN